MQVRQYTAATPLDSGTCRPAQDKLGARVRLAGRAFQAMRHRIMRQLRKTEMLAGVSHDATPLTRMRLQCADGLAP